MNLSFIVVVDQRGAMGCNNKLLWHLPDELKFFKSQTTGKTVIMGRKTFESIGRPLPNRTNIILSKSENFKVQGCETFNSIPECTAYLDRIGNKEEIFVIGGESIFEQTYGYANRLLVTVVDDVYEGADTFFPKFLTLFGNDSEVWNKPRLLLTHSQDDRHPHSYKTYEILRNKKKSAKSQAKHDQLPLFA